MKFIVTAKSKDKGEILIYSDIGESWFSEGVTAKQIAEELKALDGVSEIDVRINSYGGDLFDGLAMHTLLVAHKAKILVWVDGIAASAASVVAMAGDTITVAAAGTIMIHDAMSGCIGNCDYMRQVADVLDAQSERMAALYADRSGKPTSHMRELMMAETWFSAQEAIDEGLADAVAENLKVAAHAAPSKHPFKNLPQSLVVEGDSGLNNTRARFDARSERLVLQQARLTLAGLTHGRG